MSNFVNLFQLIGVAIIS